ncbi:MAG: hypothetical protein LCH93_13685 [Proteobacteria bacterium]|nr:hypothetical protein [Pseudomonadota bacterium]
MSADRMDEKMDAASDRDEQNGRASFRFVSLIGFATAPVPLFYQLHASILARPVRPIVDGFADKVAR